MIIVIIRVLGDVISTTPMNTDVEMVVLAANKLASHSPRPSTSSEVDATASVTEFDSMSSMARTPKRRDSVESPHSGRGTGIMDAYFDRMSPLEQVL
jgi:hypothetical protein